MTPEAIHSALDFLRYRLQCLRQSQTPGHIDLFCSVDQGRYKLEFVCGECQVFHIQLEDLAIWDSPLVARQRERLETVEKVVSLLNSALFETVRHHQGHAHITLRYRLSDRKQYGFKYQPSIVLGFNPHR